MTRGERNKNFGEKKKKKNMSPSPRRGIEPRSPAWQAGILTTILPRTSHHFMKHILNKSLTHAQLVPRSWLILNYQSEMAAFVKLTPGWFIWFFDIRAHIGESYYKNAFLKKFWWESVNTFLKFSPTEWQTKRFHIVHVERHCIKGS